MLASPRFDARATESRARRFAASHDRRHARFLRLSGDSAQGAFDGAVAASLRPGIELLDAGCGTGGTLRRALAVEPRLEAVLLDRSTAMLERCADLPARRVHGSLLALPFEDRRFDLVTCAWALETLADPLAALGELRRVTRPGGRLCAVFCSLPASADPLDRASAFAIGLRGAGRPIDPDLACAGLGRHADLRVRRLPCRGAASVVLAERAA